MRPFAFCYRPRASISRPGWSNALVHGMLRVDKPSGPTSHDVVAVVRRILGQRRVGHAGTLDPPATGLLVILFGSAARLQQYLLGEDKTYTFDLVLGRATDTLDMSGVATAEVWAECPKTESLEAACRGLEGDVALVPPMVSAIHHQGRRLHEIARAGEVVEREPRSCQIDRLSPIGPARLGEDGLVRVPLVIDCSSGTYVRSVGEALGASLGVPACIDSLRRTRVGPLSVAGAHSIDELARGGRKATLRQAEPMEQAVPHLPRVSLADAEERAFACGNPVLGVESSQGPIAVFGPSGFLGVGVAEDGQLAPRTVVGGQEPRDG